LGCQDRNIDKKDQPLKKVLFVFGTRPEAIKMAPLIKELQFQPNDFEVKVCITAQHREMLDQVLSFFEIKPDFDLNLMTPNQTLFSFTNVALAGLEPILESFTPDLIFVQGDTTTAFVGALAGFYKKIPIAHIEAGLRSGNKLSPFPEEVNRILIGHMAAYHFAPTQQTAQNLMKEGITQNVHVVGNTVIDALLRGLEIIKETKENIYKDFFKFLDPNKKTILVTAHRRESFGKPFEEMCMAIRGIVEQNHDVQIVYPVHLNPNIRQVTQKILDNCPDVHLIEPLSYPKLIWLMNESYFVITDSGGIQEEAPALGKPVLVMRDVTERVEGIEAGTAKLVGTNQEIILTEANKLIRNPHEHELMAKAVNPYGDGKSSRKIAQIIKT
jgi:UDP-N-acetylglucosamine 2-epimerase (non-hydrolysing)